MLVPNTILQDRYRIVRLLGQGGMGAVYEAIDQRVSCVVALKETLVGSSPETRKAFHREAALLANLRHSALPKVMDYFGEGAGEFLILEFIPGNDLAELMALRDAPFPPEQVLRWAIELLKLLEYLHTRDPPILHRDIKPANLKATMQGEIFLLDFGLAKGAAGQMATVETSQSVPGYTPVYAPLEQILGQGTDPRSDLYSLGATLYHLLTGQAPVSAPVRFDAVENDRPDPLKPANQLNFRVPADVAALVQKAMALSRKDRFANAAEMLAALEQAEQAAADRDTARKAEAALIETLPVAPEVTPAKPLITDKDVQFTVYTPEKIKPERTYSVLAFAHLSARRDDASPDEPDPIVEMKAQAARILGDQAEDYRDVKDASQQAVPRGGEITFVPVVSGLTFSPPSRSFTWRKSVHREEFDVWAAPDVDGQTLNGRMTVFLGSVVIAEVPLTISVDSRATSSAERIALDKSQSARRVRQVFAAYSHRDEQIVAELAQMAPIFGSRFLMGSTHLEPGEDRTEGLQRLIRDADVFQLFWSTNSMRSAETVGAIKYAASLNRPRFILPTYWEDPLPRSPADGLPPPEIEGLQFYRIYPAAISPAARNESRLVIKGPAGVEIMIDDERQGSIGNSGRVILKSIKPGKHVLSLRRSGYRDDERVIEIQAGDVEQVIEAQFEPQPTFNAPGAAQSYAPAQTFDASEIPPTVGSFDREGTPTGALPPLGQPMRAVYPAAAIVSCTRCHARYAAGQKFCGRCGNTSFEDVGGGITSPVQASQMTAPAMPAQAPPPLMHSYPPVIAKRKRGMMVPIFAGASMVLLAAILAPIFFMTYWSGSKPNLTSAPETSNKSTSTGPPSQSRTLPNAAGIDFVSIPAGSFMMGSNSGAEDEKPVHTVTISKGFYMAKYEVTQAQWEAVMARNPSRYPGANLPVESVSWTDAIAFIARLNSRNDGFKYRLPTEAEWEYAARAGTTTTYYWGDEITQACRYANVGDQSAKGKYPGVTLIECEDGYPDSAPVGKFQPNSFGLYDMSGNVAEMCQDWYDANYYRSSSGSDPLGPVSGIGHVVRGGAFGQNTSWLRSAARFFGAPDATAGNLGFRVVAMAQN
jgi:formylglycine-generating enzyme required for sulfatase activity/serine/threonine protein kinase